MDECQPLPPTPHAEAGARAARAHPPPPPPPDAEVPAEVSAAFFFNGADPLTDVPFAGGMAPLGSRWCHQNSGSGKRHPTVFSEQLVFPLRSQTEGPPRYTSSWPGIPPVL